MLVPRLQDKRHWLAEGVYLDSSELQQLLINVAQFMLY